jgi:hypothetical protein
MEKRVPRFLLPVAVPALCLLLCLPASAQLVLGQYEDEAPLGTWNVFGLPSAPSVGLGGVQFARAWDCSASLANPALLVFLPRYSVTLTGSVAWASLFKYSLVNTGVVATAGNLTARSLGIEFGGFSWRWGKWAFSAAAGILENYSRPGIVAQDAYLTDSLDMGQTGFLRDYHLAVARRVTKRFSAGLGLNYVSGRLHRQVLETYLVPMDQITITDEKDENYRGFFLNGGIAWELTDRLTAALICRSPFIKRADARSTLRYQAPAGNTDIQINAEARNEYQQPWVFGTGWCFRFSDVWTLAADLAFFGWSRYRATFFDEPLGRPFRDIVKAGAGVEYLAAGRLFGRSARIPLRLGFSYDPQPMTAPHSAYYAISLGTGFRISSLAVDLSGSIGRENGSGDSLSAGKVAMTVTYFIDR